MSMVLAAAVSASGCALSARPEVPGAARAVPPRPGWWRACRGLRLPAQVPAPGELRRRDLEAAQARLDAARRAAAANPPGLGLSNLLGLTSRGLTYLVRSGADMGQAGVGVRGSAGSVEPLPAQADLRAAAGAYRQVLDAACGDLREAAATAAGLKLGVAQASASQGDAEAATRAVRLRFAQGAASEAELEMALRELEVRRQRLAERQARLADAGQALALALGAEAP